jgi:hypothetical protein
MKLIEYYLDYSSPAIQKQITNYQKNTNFNEFMVVEGEPTKRLPIIAIEDGLVNETTRKSERSKIILVSTEFLSKSFDSVLRSCLESLCHRKVEPQTVITGLLYEGCNIGNTDIKIKETLHHVFQTYELKRKKKTLMINNPNCYTKSDYQTFYNYSTNKYNENYNPLYNVTFANINKARTAKMFYFEDDVDQIYFTKFFHDNGFNYENAKTSIPCITKKIIWTLRATKSDYIKINKNLIPKYPDSIVAEVRERRILDEKRKIISTLTKDGTSKEIAIAMLMNKSIDYLLKMTNRELVELVKSIESNAEEKKKVKKHLEDSGIISFRTIIYSKHKSTVNDGDNSDINFQLEDLSAYRDLPVIMDEDVKDLNDDNDDDIINSQNNEDEDKDQDLNDDQHNDETESVEDKKQNEDKNNDEEGALSDFEGESNLMKRKMQQYTNNTNKKPKNTISSETIMRNITKSIYK